MPSRLRSTPSNELPNELHDLITLQSSLLTALSLHYAHHSATTPVDVRILSPSIAQIWGRRKVTIDDVRLCLGVLGEATPDQSPIFYLSEYGPRKTYLEMKEDCEKQGIMGRYVDEEALNGLFSRQLKSIWSNWLAQNGATEATQNATPTKTSNRSPKSRRTTARNSEVKATSPEVDIIAFVSNLPRAEITVCSSLEKLAPLKEKGRRRLDAMKPDPLKPRTLGNSIRVEKSRENLKQKPVIAAASSRKLDLLDRILAKQALAASSPSQPTKAEMERRAALDRSEEVLQVLTMLATSRSVGQRVSFSMPTLIQSLQGSIRSPISKEEAIKCVEVIAEEVAPGYVNVVRIGELISVVVNPAARQTGAKKDIATLTVAAI